MVFVMFLFNYSHSLYACESAYLMPAVDVVSTMWETWAIVSVPQRRTTFHYWGVLRALKPVKPLTLGLHHRIRYYCFDRCCV